MIIFDYFFIIIHINEQSCDKYIICFGGIELIKKRYLSFLLSLTLITSFWGTAAYAAPSYVEEREKQIEKNNQKVKELQQRNKEIPKIQDKIQKDISSIQGELNDKGKELEKSNKQIDSCTEKISSVQNNIKKLQSNINNIESNIKEKTKEIEKKEIERKEKEELLGERLRGMYISNPYNSIIEIILESNSFSDLISKATNISMIIKSDKELIKEVEDMRAGLQSEKKKLEDQSQNLLKEKAELQSNKSELENQKKILVGEKNSKQSIVTQLNSMESQKKDMINKLGSEKKKNQDEVSELVAFSESARNEIDSFIREQINKDKNNNSSNNSNSNNSSNNSNNSSNNSNNNSSQTDNSSGYLRPTSGPITCPYGPRIHPITGAKGFHTGVDIGAGFGAPIKASKGGQVVFAGSNYIYGNMIILSHGNGVQTVYAHASSLSVSAGQQVKQGQVIARVGSTGMSTGPHLHFEIRINGNTVNPMSYIN